MLFWPEDFRRGIEMPIFEYYCKPCHTIFSFLARSLSKGAVPACPRCKGALVKQVSSFSVTHGTGDADDGDADFPVDDARLEQAMESMAGDLEGMNEEDPRQAAQLMRKFSQLTGMKFNDGIEEALNRMERGEDPEKIESEMGDMLDDDDPFVTDEGRKALKKLLQRHRGEPKRDPALYDM